MLLRILLTVESPTLERRMRRLARGADVVVSPHRLSDWPALLAGEAYDLVIVDRASFQNSIVETLEQARAAHSLPPVVLFSAETSEDETAQLTSAGCWAILSPATSDRALRAALGAVVQRIRRFGGSRHPEGHLLRSTPAPSQRRSSGWARAIRRMSTTDSAVLIRGERGAGKAWVARAIHQASRRAKYPFVAFHCRQVPPRELNDALFGRDPAQGTAQRSALFRAHRGTLLLEGWEVLPAEAQAGILRLLQDRVVEPAGESRAVPVDVRVLATLPPQEAESPPEGIRADLYYRLANVAFDVPPLRERRDEIPDLLDHYLHYFAREFGCGVEGYAHDALNELVDYAWPGNVRELINLVERSVLLCRGSQITLHDLPESVGAWRREHEEERYGNAWTEYGRLRDLRSKPWREVRQDLIASAERTYLAELLRACDGKIGETAARAGMLPRALYAKMKQHGLRKETFRPARRRSRAGRTKG